MSVPTYLSEFELKAAECSCWRFFDWVKLINEQDLSESIANSIWKWYNDQVRQYSGKLPWQVAIFECDKKNQTVIVKTWSKYSL